ncbi:haloacid dehalogenase, type II [Sphingopyxis bauzanensis]|uniref:(S)-2-haloacid dehalogenase n=1 Tax=Sphingopyxis bauzanensis TaxID=651663 RepID=A0A246JWF8_9SPHN|nr:haloacid dehalogenase type II [Sphingopyxis bauzanensis]OWQ97409.1 haloacid dehalogenase, type II [Sphingopyxis bauzanensis]GGJ36764.1 haloacid dehalogenase [Sphingopyxis bauzanensis]
MTEPTAARPPKALAFDVFGTVVDWRSSIARESATFLAKIDRSDIEPHDFADQWRRRYLPAMAGVSGGQRGFVKLDILHREMLDALLHDLDIDPAALEPALLANWADAWHRLAPWPDSVAGIARLRTAFPVVTLSNGNVSLMVDMARRAGIIWDAILGAEYARAYKPQPAAYLATADALGLAPQELCLVASHHSDLAAARGCGLMTAHIDRPMEYGGARAPDADAAQDWEYSADSLTALAAQMGC